MTQIFPIMPSSGTLPGQGPSAEGASVPAAGSGPAFTLPPSIKTSIPEAEVATALTPSAAGTPNSAPVLPAGSSAELALLKQEVAQILGALDLSSAAKEGTTPQDAVALLVASAVEALEAIDTAYGSQLVPHLTAAIQELGATGADSLSNWSAPQAVSDALTLIADALQINLPQTAASAVQLGQQGSASPALQMMATTQAPGLTLSDAFAGLQPTGSALTGQATATQALIDPAFSLTQARTDFAPSAAASAQASTPDANQLKQAVLRQIAQADLPMPLHEMGKTRIELTPAGLGRLELEVETLAQAGLRVLLRADNPLVLEALRLDRSGLEAALTGNGSQTNAQSDGRAFSFESFEGRSDRGSQAASENGMGEADDGVFDQPAEDAPALRYGPLTIDILA